MTALEGLASPVPVTVEYRRRTRLGLPDVLERTALERRPVLPDEVDGQAPLSLCSLVALG